MNNLKIGNITYNNVETIKVKNADNESEYIEFRELKEQEKSIEITENGTIEVLPDSGKTLSKVSITTNIPEVDTSDATATASTILSGSTAYVNGSKITGTIVTYKGEVE